MDAKPYLDGFEFTPQMAVESLIDKSITERYDGPLDRGEGRHGEIFYWPIDIYRLCELLVELWDELLTPEAINEAFDRLVEWDRTRDEWPHGSCEADEVERPLSSFDDPNACEQFVNEYGRAEHDDDLLGC